MWGPSQGPLLLGAQWLCPGVALVAVWRAPCVTKPFVMNCIGLGLMPESLVDLADLVTLGSHFLIPHLRVHGVLSNLSSSHWSLQAAHLT